jgi:N-acyl homoserine lactone hydrolase
MRIHAIQTGTVAVKARQRAGTGPGPLRLVNTLRDKHWTEPLPILAWLIEHPEGLIVVDTGETARSAEKGYFPAWHPYYRLGVREWVANEQEIGPRIERLGFSTDDVRWVVLTHLHTDHAGGIAHFPNSELLVTRTELDHASGTLGKLRGYLPHRWPEWFSPTPVDLTDTPYGPVKASRPLTTAGDIILLSTPGHTPGHMSVAIEMPGQLVILAGDASYTEQLMLDGIADGVTNDPTTANASLTALSNLAKNRRTIYLPSHDPASQARLAASTAGHRPTGPSPPQPPADNNIETGPRRSATWRRRKGRDCGIARLSSEWTGRRTTTMETRNRDRTGIPRDQRPNSEYQLTEFLSGGSRIRTCEG